MAADPQGAAACLEYLQEALALDRKQQGLVEAAEGLLRAALLKQDMQVRVALPCLAAAKSPCNVASTRYTVVVGVSTAAACIQLAEPSLLSMARPSLPFNSAELHLWQVLGDAEEAAKQRGDGREEEERLRKERLKARSRLWRTEVKAEQGHKRAGGHRAWRGRHPLAARHDTCSSSRPAGADRAHSVPGS